MRILLAIHPHTLSSGEFNRFLAQHLKKDKNTFLLVFPSYPQEKEAFERLKQKFAKFKENFIYIEPRSFFERSRFSSYRRQFWQAIKLLQKKLLKNESMKVISFGGSTWICYHNINVPAHEAIMKMFGKEHKLKASSFLPFIYGWQKSWPYAPKPKIRRRK